MGCILYVFWPLQVVLDTLKSSELFMQILSITKQVVNGAFYPLIYVG